MQGPEIQFSADGKKPCVPPLTFKYIFLAKRSNNMFFFKAVVGTFS